MNNRVQWVKILLEIPLNIGPNFIEAAQNNFAYQSKVTSQSTMSHALFMTGILLAFAEHQFFLGLLPAQAAHIFKDEMPFSLLTAFCFWKKFHCVPGRRAWSLTPFFLGTQRNLKIVMASAPSSPLFWTKNLP